MDCIGFEGVKAAVVPATTVRSPRAASVALRTAVAVIASGDDGAITAWRRDDGSFTAVFSRLMCVKAKANFITRTQLEIWLRDKWPDMTRDYKKGRA